jgi:hypothetical protein
MIKREIQSLDEQYYQARQRLLARRESGLPWSAELAELRRIENLMWDEIGVMNDPVERCR